MNLFKANPTKDFNKSKHAKNVYGREYKPSKLKVQKKSEEDNIIKNKRNCFKLKKKMKQLKIE